MKLVTMILMAVSLAACHVEGPGAGKAKGDDDSSPEEIAEEPKEVWATFRAKSKQGEKSFAVMINFDKDQISIREIDDAGKITPTSDKCSDRFDGIRSAAG